MIKTITLGCRFNFYESEKVKAILSNLQYSKDIIFINTCSVTQQAENQSKQYIRRAIRKYPNSEIIVSGCALTTCREYLNSLPIKLISNNDKTKISSYTTQDLSNINIENTIFSDRSKVFLQIQSGCSNFCSYCIVPFSRGKPKSIPLSDILQQVKNIKQKEIILSGIDITSYGIDLGHLDLVDVINAILDTKPDLQRLRISSMNPSGISNKLIDVINSEPRILPHLHLSLQSGDDFILQQMHRKYSAKDVLDLLHSIKRNIVIGADVIAGFPSETDENFNNTVEFIKKSGISLLHVFPFSPRPGTLAATFIQLPKNVIKQRAEQLRMLSQDLTSKLLMSFIGKNVNGLVEKTNGSFATGKTDHFLNFKINKPIPINTVINDMKVKCVENDVLICE